MVYAYIRVSTDTQSFSSQKFEIRNWAEKQGMDIAKWYNESASGMISIKKRALGHLIKRMKKDDLLVCTELSRLGRNMLMIMSVLNDCAAKGIRIHTIKDNFILSNDLNSKIIAFAFALAAEIERNLISQRTREALAERKAAGRVLGRPKGSFKCKERVYREYKEIHSRLSCGESMTMVAKDYKIHRNTLSRYLKEYQRRSK